jgi:hypothetical protein
MMKTLIIAAVAAAVAVVLLAIVAFIVRKRKRRINPDTFNARWQELQAKCRTRTTWPDAIVEADLLLEEALKRSGYKGRTTGERLVAAQHKLTSNDQVWFGHKYRTKIVGEDVRKLKKQDVILALSGFRQALRDLGALRSD